VYADWLEGDAVPPQPDRAEFIRVGCELTSFPVAVTGRLKGHAGTRGSRIEEACPERQRPEGVAHESDCHFAALEERERELINANALEWFPGMMVTLESERCRLSDTFRGAFVQRGFVWLWQGTAAAWLARADAPTSSQPIERVRLTTWPDYGDFDAWGITRGNWTQWGDTLSGVPRQFTSDRWPDITFELTLVDDPETPDAFRAAYEAGRRNSDEYNRRVMSAFLRLPVE
jgi:hypothetical protein